MTAVFITSNLGESLLYVTVLPSLTFLRPGWKEFLTEIAGLYEMHVYTMGTRAYAEEVCAAIDPDGKAFGGRILSRDESGSECCIIHVVLSPTPF